VALEGAFGERRFDAVVETTGSRESIALAGRLAESGGRVLLFGIPDGHRAEIDVLDAIWREVTYLPSGNAPRVWPRVAALVAAGLVDLEPLVDCRLPFEKLDEAVRIAAERREACIKVAVE
jgi:threonine dehydrogenase-like Zn-dependent dehydrogenase